MIVGVAQHKINEMKKCAEDIENCIGKLNCEEDKDKIKIMEQKYGLTLDLLHQAGQFLSIIAKNFQEDFDLCEVNCQCW